ncbi:MAG: polyprenyl synthetase family protein, partial [Terriglobales bacterium]
VWPLWIASERTEFERRFARALPSETTEPRPLHQAMRYSALAGGKRLRPLLCRAAAYAVAGAAVEAAWAPAQAVEMIHTYSLIHDDLPALDNDDLRRGQPTCHVVHGEAMAILAGDALLTLAFAQLENAAMVRELALAAGTPAGMVAGQAADLAAQLPGMNLDAVNAIHRGKTGALITASVLMGGRAAGASVEQLGALRGFGQAIGLAFQITDDLLDISGTTAQLGKTAGKDAGQAKATYPAIAGVEAAAIEARRQHDQALAQLQSWPDSADRLRELAQWMVARQR